MDDALGRSGRGLSHHHGAAHGQEADAKEKRGKTLNTLGRNRPTATCGQTFCSTSRARLALNPASRLLRVLPVIVSRRAITSWIRKSAAPPFIALINTSRPSGRSSRRFFAV